MRFNIFLADIVALFTAAGGERSETHYAEKGWGREMASKRRRSGASEWEGGSELENSFVGKMGEENRRAEVLPLKHERRTLGQWSNPVSDSGKSQASSPWAKQHRV